MTRMIASSIFPYIIGIIALLLFAGKCCGQLQFPSFDSLWHYTDKHSITLQSTNLYQQQAKQAKIAAIIGIPELTGNIGFSYTNNTKLPINLFPGEAFGGQPGTYKEVQTGVQYVSNLTESIDIKLVNPKGWASLKLSQLNLEATASGNLLTRKLLLENVAVTYYNILGLQEQLVAVTNNKNTADSLLFIVNSKMDQGLARQQDVNYASINSLSLGESARQLSLLLTRQYLALKIQCDIPVTDSVLIRRPIFAEDVITDPEIKPVSLAATDAHLKELVANANYHQYRLAMYPTLSFFQAYTTQQFNTNSKLFDKGVSWIPNSYVGIRLNIPIPNAGSLSQVSKAKFDWLLARNNTLQLQTKTAIENQQLGIDFQKAVSQYEANKLIYGLRVDTYRKNLSLYQEGLSGPGQTLTSFDEMVESNYNMIASKIDVELSRTKIMINNTIR